MTAAQRATLETAKGYHAARVFEYRETGETAMADKHQRVADALRAALGTCGNCAHANVDDAPSGSAYCTARMDDAHPFAARPMPLGERCTGYTVKEGA